MDLREIAQGAPYCLATSIKECPFDRFWVVLLENEVEVYQSALDGSLDEPNPWMRLKILCRQQNVKIVNMAMANKALDPDSQINLDPDADGYYYSERKRFLLCANPRFTGYQDDAEGVGELHGSTLKIFWMMADGGCEVEERDLSEHPKSGNISLIRV